MPPSLRPFRFVCVICRARRSFMARDDSSAYHAIAEAGCVYLERRARIRCLRCDLMLNDPGVRWMNSVRRPQKKRRRKAA